MEIWAKRPINSDPIRITKIFAILLSIDNALAELKYIDLFFMRPFQEYKPLTRDGIMEM